MKRYFNIALLALVSATVLFYIVVSVNMTSMVENRFNRFDSIVKSIEIRKQQIIMLGLFAESERQMPVLVKDDSLNDYDIFVYATQDNQALTENEQVIYRVLQLSQKFLPALFSDNNVFMYYRSYEGKKHFTSDAIDDFPVGDDLFSLERCSVHESCSIFAKSYQLKDRVIISPVYRDLLTNEYIVSMSSPVRDYVTKDIIGDFVVDFHIPRIELQGVEFRTEKSKSYKTTIFEFANLPFSDVKYEREFIADNRTKFKYIIPASLFVIELSGLWFLFIAVFAVVFWKWEESRSSRYQLKKVMISANEDELTGLFNRKVFKDEDFLRTVYDNTTSVIVVDGNKIKKINDLHGHAVGDLAIQHIANSMREVFRESDYLIRNGGDEFIAVLPGCDLEVAELLAHQLKEKVTSNAVEPFNTHVSVSTGACVKEEFEDIKSVISRADTKLYEEKRLIKDLKMNNRITQL